MKMRKYIIGAFLLQIIAFICIAHQKGEDKLSFLNSYIGTAGADDAGYGGVNSLHTVSFCNVTQWTTMTCECQIGKTFFH